MAGSPPLVAARLAALVVLCLTIAEIDLRLQIVPDALVAAVLLVAVVAPAPLDRTAQLVGSVVTGGLFLIVRQACLWWRGEDGLGLGDVKLAAAMGALLGAEISLLAAAAAAAGTAAWIAARRLTGSGHTAGAPLGVGLA
ncbi:prepilin peptidase, partial [Caulobacter sp. 17J65-9]|uniref:prepilin peptidase n=1 Tax=Caulobacter sp. 17J65-9 TaxID=2709382 RepID=UPI001969C544